MGRFKSTYKVEFRSNRAKNAAKSQALLAR